MDYSFLHNSDLCCRFAFSLKDQLDKLSMDDDVDGYTAKFLDIVKSTTMRFARIKSVNHKNSNRKGWITNAIKNAATKRDKLYKNMVSHPGVAALKMKYVDQRNKVSAMIRKAKTDSFARRVDNSLQNKSYKVINEILGNASKFRSPTSIEHNGTVLVDGHQIANTFNDYFVTVGPKLAADIASLPRPSNRSSTSHNIFLRPTTRHEVELIINQLANKAAGDDDIPAKVLKKVSYVVGRHISDLINKCYETGKFPSSLKIAKVVPIYKEGNLDSVSNYRPISILSAVSKIFERTIFNRMYDFLDKKSLLYRNQFGFRSKRSTTHALVEIVERIRNGQDANETACCIFLDLSKAFDTLNHQILLDKLERHGIRGQVYQLLENYLQNRKQYVKLISSKSDLLDITCGVPQGSILGPLLFLIYVNDISTICEKSVPFLFADDTNLIGFNRKGSTDFMQEDTQRIYEWLCANKLSLNIGKSSTLTFNATSVENLICGNVPISHSTNCKYLGVRLDANLGFDDHIKMVVKKLSRHAGIISKIRHYLPRKTVVLYYKQYVQPVIQYGLLVYGCTTQSKLKPILLQQKKIVRLIYF